MPDPIPMQDAGWQDAQDVAAARAGKQAAFDNLVQRYQRRAVSVAYRLLGNIHDASDVAQDAFLRAYRNLDKLDDPRRFGPWTMRIVTNLSLNYRRSRARSAASSVDDLVEGNEPLRSPSGAALADVGGAAGELDAADMQEVVSRALAELPEKQRVALTLFSIEGMPQKEVAQIMNCSIELVKWNVFQARKAMRKALAGYLE